MKPSNMLQVGVVMVIVMLCGAVLVNTAYSAETLTYYLSGRLATKTLTNPDANGKIYYSYLDENWLGQGYGRVSKTRRQVALNGEFSYRFAYFADKSGLRSVKKVYSDANWTVLFATYTYYNNTTNRMASKTLTTADTQGNIYYAYLDENWKTQGYGRMYQTRRQTAKAGALSFTYTYYADAAGRLKSKNAYSDNNWTMFVNTRTYYNDTANMMESKTLGLSDADGKIYYRYINENWKTQGYGRCNIAITTQRDATGAVGYRYEYYNGTSQVRVKYCYSSINITNPSSPVLTYLVAIYSYNADGTLIGNEPAWIGSLDQALNSETLRIDFKLLYGIHFVNQDLTNSEYLWVLNGILEYMSKNPSYTVAAFQAEVSNVAALHRALDDYDLEIEFATAQHIPVLCQVFNPVTNVAPYDYHATLATIVNSPGYSLSNYLSSLRSGDIAADFGVNGFYRYHSGAWTKLSIINADSFMLSSPKIDGTYDIVTDFGVGGLCRYSNNNNACTKLSSMNADSFMLSALYNNSYDIVSDFGTSGLYRYSGTTWTRLTTLNADSFMLSALYNNSYDIVSDFGTSGFYRYSGTTWTQLSTLNAESFMLSSWADWGSYDIVADFGTSGLYRYSGTTWTRLSTMNADSFMLTERGGDPLGDILDPSFNAYDVIADFGANGFYRYSDTTWTRLSTMNADSFTVTERDYRGVYNIMADFGANGLYQYANNTWTKLSANNADNEVSQMLDVNGQVRKYGKDAEGGFTSTTVMVGEPTKPTI